MKRKNTFQNKVQLITYPDSLGRNLSELYFVLQQYLKTAVGGVHILPFYPSSADRGFSPLTYDTVDSRFGSWKDIRAISSDFDLTVDFMVNHISRQSLYFQDYIKKGAASEYADMFLSFRKISPDGDIAQKDLNKIYTRKPGLPITEIERSDGSREKLWCTFGDEQIDLDFFSPKTRKIMRHFLSRLAKCGTSIIRLDAFAYTTFKLGTQCFFLEPEVWELLKWIDDCVSTDNIRILPEVHEHYSYQQKLAQKGYLTYDFALPMLVLHAFFNHTNTNLIHWLKICPRNQITTLDTHDGIGIVDVVDLLSREQIDLTIDQLYQKGSNAKRLYSSAKYNNLDIYQVNCTYFSALSGNPDAYLAARAIQFFAPGIPHVYYVGLLAGKNDIELVEKTRQGRDINRHNYSLAEVRREMEKPVVRRLLKLMEFRNSHPAFHGEFRIMPSESDKLILMWQKGPHEAVATVNLEHYQTTIAYTDGSKQRYFSFEDNND